MKKLLSLFAVSTLGILFTACGSKDKQEFTGYWLEGESELVFEVINNNGQFIIRNVNGDLTAEKNSDGKICGNNTLGMQYCMSVEGDFATYEFAGIVTSYKRISKSQYDRIAATKTKATFQPVVQSEDNDY